MIACAIPAIMPTIRERQLDWLTSVFEKTGLSVPQLADKAKIDVSTIYKFQSGAIEMMRDRTVLRIGQVAGVAMPDVPGLSDGDAVEFDMSSLPDMSALSDNPRYFALKVKSDALGQAGIAEGDILVFDGEPSAQSGDIVCAQIVDYRLGTAETVIRCYDKPYLIALSDNPQHRRPIIVDDDRVQIRGVLTKQIRVKLFGSAA